MYITVAELKNRLMSKDIPVPKKILRVDLIQLCRDHGVVTDSEVSTKAIRRDWLVAALRNVGCELRDDSRLCEAYIDYGHGNLQNICSIMAEMKFYYDHTDYASILEALYDKAQEEYDEEMNNYNEFYDDRDFRPRFNKFFDSYDASDTAKSEAIERWFAQYTNPKDALDHPELPGSLRDDILNSMRYHRFTEWLNKAFRVKTSRNYGMDLAKEWLATAPPEALTNEIFSERFGNAIRVHWIVEHHKNTVRERVKKWLGELASSDFGCRVVQDVIGSIKSPDNLPNWTVEMLDDKYADLAAEERKCLEERNRKKREIVAKQSSKYPLFAKTIVGDINEIPDDTNMIAALGKLGDNIKNINWKCGWCNYTGKTLGLWQHSVTKHKVKKIQGVQCKQV